MSRDKRDCFEICIQIYYSFATLLHLIRQIINFVFKNFSNYTNANIPLSATFPIYSP